jgi:hypothetical protein
VQVFSEGLNNRLDPPTLGSVQTSRNERRSVPVDLNTLIVAVFYEVDNPGLWSRRSRGGAAPSPSFPIPKY